MKLQHAQIVAQKSAKLYPQEIWLLKKQLVNYQLNAAIVLMSTLEILLKNMRKNYVKKGILITISLFILNLTHSHFSFYIYLEQRCANLVASVVNGEVHSTKFR